MDIQQVIQKTQEMTYAASGAVTSFGVWTWLADNATAIGAICMIGGLMLGAGTFLVNWYYRHKALKLKK